MAASLTLSATKIERQIPRPAFAGCDVFGVRRHFLFQTIKKSGKSKKKIASRRGGAKVGGATVSTESKVWV
jgi:hypothetical protein